MKNIIKNAHAETIKTGMDEISSIRKTYVDHVVNVLMDIRQGKNVDLNSIKPFAV